MAHINKTLWIGAGIALAMASCGGNEVDIERARYLLGKGSKSAALEAISLLEPKLATTSGEEKFEVVQLYSGARMQAAGFSGVKIISSLIYRGNTGSGEESTVGFVRRASDLDSDSETNLIGTDGAIPTLTGFQADAVYTGSNNTALKDIIEYQLGLAYFLEVLRDTLQSSGLGATGSVPAACETNLETNGFTFTDVRTRLTSSRTELLNSGLDSTNEFVDLVTDFRDAIPTAGTDAQQRTEFCNYLNRQTQ